MTTNKTIREYFNWGTHYIYTLQSRCNLQELYEVMTSDLSIRDKKTWLYGVDIYGNEVEHKFEHSFGIDENKFETNSRAETKLDYLWESWINRDD